MSSAQRSRGNTFAALELNRLAEYREDAGWLDQHASGPGARFIALDAQGRAFARDGGDGLVFLDGAQRAKWLPEAPAHLLGVTPEAEYFLLRVDQSSGAPLTREQDGQWLGLRDAGHRCDPFSAGLFAYAAALAHWQMQTRFCSACGGTLTLMAAGHRARCDACGVLHFPRTDPAVIMIVEHDGACLLARQAGWPARRYSTLAGFVEPGETPEDAVRREVAEETGVEILDCDYHSSQPWPFPASLMLGFTAHAVAREIRLADGELEHARWFTPAQLLSAIEAGEIQVSSPLSVSFRLIEHWLAERSGLDLRECLSAMA